MVSGIYRKTKIEIMLIPLEVVLMSMCGFRKKVRMNGCWVQMHFRLARHVIVGRVQMKHRQKQHGEKKYKNNGALGRLFFQNHIPGWIERPWINY